MIHTSGLRQEANPGDRRAFIRVPVKLAATLWRDSEREPVVCGNMSLGGLGLEGEVPLEEGARFQISLSIPDQVPIEGVVEVVHAIGPAGRSAGAQFVDPTVPLLSRLFSAMRCCATSAPPHFGFFDGEERPSSETERPS